LKPGYGLAVRTDETDKTYPAAITRVGGRVDPVSQTIKVFGEIRGEAAELMAGMSGRAISQRRNERLTPLQSMLSWPKPTMEETRCYH
jgi:hypothetical protein